MDEREERSVKLLRAFAVSRPPKATYGYNCFIFNNIMNISALTFLKLTGLCILRSNF